jgi:hypothetical protein
MSQIRCIPDASRPGRGCPLPSALLSDARIRAALDSLDAAYKDALEAYREAAPGPPAVLAAVRAADDKLFNGQPLRKGLTHLEVVAFYGLFAEGENPPAQKEAEQDAVAGAKFAVWGAVHPAG